MIYKGYSHMEQYNTFTGGKYRGRRLIDIIKGDKSYVTWALTHVSSFNISPDLMSQYFSQVKLSNGSGPGGVYDNPLPRLETKPKTRIVAMREAHLNKKTK